MTTRYGLPATTLVFFVLAFAFSRAIQLPDVTVDKQRSSFTVRAELLGLVGVGLKRPIADLMWVKSLLDSDLEHYSGKDLGSWLYVRFMTISLLDPRFYENYHYGSQYLMVVKDDLAGSEDLLRRGLQVYPDDLNLNWHLGFLLAIEKGEVARALPYLDKLRGAPQRPPQFDSLYTRLRTDFVEHQVAFDYAFEQWQKMPDGDRVKLRLDQHLYTLRALMDLECLNADKPGCRREDWHGNPYVKNGATWSAREPLVRKFRSRHK